MIEGNVVYRGDAGKEIVHRIFFGWQDCYVIENYSGIRPLLRKDSISSLTILLTLMG